MIHRILPKLWIVLVIPGCWAADEHYGETPLSPEAKAARTASEEECNIPPEANHAQGYLSFASPPYGFVAATPWLTVVHDRTSSAPSMVKVNYIRLHAAYGETIRTISANNYSPRNGSDFAGQMCPRTPWYGGSSGIPPCAHMTNVRFERGWLVLPVSESRDSIWHPFLNTPAGRADLGDPDSVWMSAEVRINGPAMVQAGIDYYRSTSVLDTAHQEGGVSAWNCASGRKTMRIDKSTDVIKLRIPTGKVYTAGDSIEASFTVRNRSRETLPLTGIGIEVRFDEDNTGRCYWKEDTWEGTIGWTENIAFAPGAGLTRGGLLSLPRAGRYCLAVVENRQKNGEDIYLRTHYRAHHRYIRVNP